MMALEEESANITPLAPPDHGVVEAEVCGSTFYVLSLYDFW